MPGRADRVFPWRLAIWLGAGLLASAAVCWIAANWPYASALQKLAGTQAALAAGALLAAWRLWRRPDDVGVAGVAANALGLAAVLTGALLALIGQIYQTGADPWQLFAVWTLLILPWVLAMPTVFLLCLWAAVLNTALALFLSNELGLRWTHVAAGMTALNLMLLALREWAGGRLALDDAWRIAPRAAMMAVTGWWLAGFLIGVAAGQPYALALGWPGLVIGAVLSGVYTRAKPDAAMLSLLGLTACAAACALILERLDMTISLPIIILMLVLAFILGARHLLAVARKSGSQRLRGEEPWFISAFRLVLMGLAAVMCLLFAMLVLELDETAGGVLGAVLMAAGLWALRTHLERSAGRDLGIVLLTSGYVMYAICVMAASSDFSAGPVAAVAVPAAIIYALAPIFVMRLFSALAGVGIVVLYVWQGPWFSDPWVEDQAWLLRASYERLLVLSLAALAAWRWVAADERRQGHVALAWALSALALVSGWWSPALSWRGDIAGAQKAVWVLGAVLAVLPLYAQATLLRGAGWGLSLYAALVLLVASVGWLGAPGVAVALTWLMLGWALHRPALLGLSAVALLTYLGQFYYQLDTSLLQKSWVLGATGAWLLLGALALAAYRGKWRREPSGRAAAARGRGLRWRLLVVLAGLLAILAAANWAIAQRENVLRHGQPVVLQLAPVDPRSLMQGDYMALRYEVSDQVAELLRASPELDEAVHGDGAGVLLLKADADGVHRLRGVLTTEQAGRSAPSADGEAKLVFRLRDGDVRVVTDAWFFPEGQAKHYEQARYGLFKVDGRGKGLLVDLLDEQRRGLKSRASGR